MEDYTPTTEAVRSGFVLLAAGDNLGAQQEAANGFDRWLDDHDVEVAAAALKNYAHLRYLENPEIPWDHSREQGNCVIPHDAASTREAVATTRLYHQIGDAEFIAAARAFVPKALAALDAVLAMHAPSKEPTSGHYYCDSDECDRAGEGELRDACQHCGHWFPCPTTAAIEQALS